MGPDGMRRALDDAVDWTREMHALLGRVPGLDWLRPQVADGPHMAVWGDGENAKRETLRELVLYLQARFPVRDGGR